MGAGNDHHRADRASGKEKAKGKACGWLILVPIEWAGGFRAPIP